MNGYNSEWRICAKVVAFMDLIFTVLHLLAFLPLIYIMTDVSLHLLKDPRMGSLLVDEFLISNIVAMWFTVAVVPIKIVAGLWAVHELIKASELGRDPNCAFKSCVCWLIVSIKFFMLTVICGCWLQLHIPTIACLIVEMILMFVVCMFMMTLK